MFARKSLKPLESWYQSRKRKPLILRGARQVGKSSLVSLFARLKNLNLIEINFETTFLESLKKSIIDIELVLQDLELITGRKLNPQKDLIFLDEIQKCPNALLSLRYFYEKKSEYAVIAAGSLLDFLLQDTEISFPVGRVDFLALGPVSFSEFLKATKQDLLYEEFNKDLQKSSNVAHRLLMDQYRIFCAIGGMPESVQTYLDSKDFFAVRKIHRSILQAYKADFLKYAKKHEIFRCEKIFDYAPTHLGQKVKYTEIDPNEKARDLRKAIETLRYARVLYSVSHTNATAVPLQAFMDDTVFKLFFLDIGLSLTHAEEEFKNILHGESVLSGPMAEQYVAQHIAHLDPEQEPSLFYWLRDKSSAKAEVDFVVSQGQKILPIEVKSNQNIQLKSLHVFMAEHKKLNQAVTVSGNPYEKKLITVKVKFENEIRQIKYELINMPLWAVEKLDVLLHKVDIREVLK